MTVESIPDTEGDISAATDILTTELEQITDEIEAFERFDKKVSKIETDPDPIGSPHGVGYQQISLENGCSKVRAAYKETVMSIPHYEDEYGDTYPSSVKEEFGTDIAVALTQSSNFTLISKSALVDSIQSAIDERKKLRDVVLLEKKSITTLRDDLRNINKNINKISDAKFSHLDFVALDAYRTQIKQLFDKCDKILLKYQNRIREIQKIINTNAPRLSIHKYFYQSLSTDYPILSRIGETSRKIKN